MKAESEMIQRFSALPSDWKSVETNTKQSLSNSVAESKRRLTPRRSRPRLSRRTAPATVRTRRLTAATAESLVCTARRRRTGRRTLPRRSLRLRALRSRKCTFASRRRPCSRSLHCGPNVSQLPFFDVAVLASRQIEACPRKPSARSYITVECCRVQMCFGVKHEC